MPGYFGTYHSSGGPIRGYAPLTIFARPGASTYYKILSQDSRSGPGIVDCGEKEKMKWEDQLPPVGTGGL